MKKVGLLFALLLIPASLLGQDEVPRGEIGVSYELFQAAHLNSVLGNANFDRTNSGVSFRGTVNINRWAAVETTFGVQPKFSVRNIAGISDSIVLGGGAEFDVLHQEVRFKGTARTGDNDQLGFFAFVGPGWLRGDPNAVMEQLIPDSFTRFTVEFGGGVEYYPHRNFGVRLDLSDLVIKLNTLGGVDQNTTNNFVLRVGASFRFR